jgi:hypothetical protein
MSLPKKTLMACVSAAALVASVGFVQAQSADQDALDSVNVNGGVDRGEDTRTYDADRLAANNVDPVDRMAAGTSTMTSANPTARPAQDGMSATAPAAAGDWSNVVAANTDATTSGAPVHPATVAPNATAATAPTPDGAMSNNPSNTGSMAPTTDSSNTTVTSAPETRIDLSPPSEPLYNLPREGSERAPRPDRN